MKDTRPNDPAANLAPETTQEPVIPSEVPNEQSKESLPEIAPEFVDELEKFAEELKQEPTEEFKKQPEASNEESEIKEKSQVQSEQLKEPEPKQQEPIGENKDYSENNPTSSSEASKVPAGNLVKYFDGTSHHLAEVAKINEDGSQDLLVTKEGQAPYIRSRVYQKDVSQNNNPGEYWGKR